MDFKLDTTPDTTKREGTLWLCTDWTGICEAYSLSQPPIFSYYAVLVYIKLTKQYISNLNHLQGQHKQYTH